MTKIAIIGGGLQGLEVAYLALKAEMETIVIDKKDNVIARNIANYFFCTDVLKKDQKLIDELKKVDIIIPALENYEALNVLNELASENHLILAFDLKAYNITSSKILSDRIIRDNNIAAPRHYPNCPPPYIAKPSEGSGSDEIYYLENKSSAENFLESRSNDKKWVIQEYISGKSYSLEIVGVPGNYRTYQMTEIIVDEVYDCKRVYAPCNESPQVKNQLINMTLKLANILNLKGIMDIEVINHNGTLKVLEIDGRMPSQTPTVVYHSSGINLVEELKDIFINQEFKNQELNSRKYVSYEHLLIENNQIKILGEHIMVDAGPLNLKTDFCGADEVLTNYTLGINSWKGTFINIANTKKGLEEKRHNMFQEIKILHGRGELELIDLSPSFK